ncbi:queuosine biosynthesis protein QueD [Piscirickettsia salmonis]|uniref:6-pyruvoyl trahydropterin synthase family protein n=1 Tax=Piscirickettsia salmonis TaxID=1238 RepID=UPI0012B75D44|nr:6-carboxytetrahydropterin synthase [Piscirickettsia salmonis]QGP51778.1 queuosine biosynthesis protein QueD [Piscirickettsia salmonis]QGP52979.1 queuosine biosynthesis protein QueD [Piscirickettsia salmonis]QGP61090.1 queuosine biosynthesis protein QueD [Piscirickettsia salmonis]QGP62551.1 queuosine biosynthesis protein QueD [Piscirickettsia salmonis]
MYTLKIFKERFHFCSAHFCIFSNRNKENLHGHNYYIDVEFSGEKIENGFLYPVADLKEIIQSTCDNLDEKVLIQGSSPYLTNEQSNEYITIYFNNKMLYKFPRDEVIILPIKNTTMECLAEYLLTNIKNNISRTINTNFSKISLGIAETQGQKLIIEQQLS